MHVATVLLVTKDRILSQEISEAMRGSGYQVVVDQNGVLSRDAGADLILIDSRDLDPKTERLAPMIGLIIDDEINDEPLSLFDDIVFPPFDIKQLIVRIRKLLLKTGAVDDGKKIIVDELMIDLESYEVRIEGKRVELTYKEYELLKHLAAHPGRVYDRQTLLNSIWDYDYFGGTRTVDVHIRRLRAKLGTKYGAMIETVRQVGYRFSGEK